MKLVSFRASEFCDAEKNASNNQKIRIPEKPHLTGDGDQLTPDTAECAARRPPFPRRAGR
jgi:hypothetical protein